MIKQFLASLRQNMVRDRLKISLGCEWLVPIKHCGFMSPKSGRLALKVTVIYVIVAACWILFSDEFVGLFIADPQERTKISIFKGWAFVILTGLMLYRLIKTLLARWSRQVEEQIVHLEEQKEQAKIFRELFLVVQDAVFLVDVESQNILDANPAAEKMYGYTRAEFLEKQGADISAEPEATRQVIAMHQNHIPLRWHRRKNGEVFPIEATTNCFDYRGRTVHVAVMRDITERRKAESILQESESRYRRLFEFESDAIIVLDRDTLDIVDVNQSAIGLYGYSREEFLRLKGPDVSAEPELSRQAIQNDHKLSPVRWHQRKNGERFPVEIFGNNFELDGRRMKMGAVRDISARYHMEQALKRSEEKYRSLFEHMNEGVAYCQMAYEGGEPVDYVHLMVNEKGVTIAGLKDVTGRRATELMPDFREKDAETFNALSRVATTGAPETAEFYVASLQKWLHLSIYSPQQGFFVVVYADITERKQAEERLRQQSALINSLLDSIPDLIFYKDLNGVYLGCNPAMAATTSRNTSCSSRISMLPAQTCYPP